MLTNVHGPDDLSLIASNWGSNYALASIGTSVDSNASSNVMGTPVTLLSALAEDCVDFSFDVLSGTVSGSSRQFLGDILFDPAGGTSWQTLVENLVFFGPSAAMGGHRFRFPLFLKAGWSIGFQVQATAAGPRNIRCAISAYGRPRFPWRVKCGSRVVTYGAVRASSIGTSVTPGTSALGSWVSFGTLARRAWWWQLGVTMNDNDTSPGGTSQGYFGDIGVGDGTTKIIAAEHIPFATNTSEGMGKGAAGRLSNTYHAPAGDTVYVRMACQGTPDAAVTATVHAVED